MAEMDNTSDSDESSTQQNSGCAAGGIIAGCGGLVAIGPIILTPISCAIQGSPGGCLDGGLSVFLTAPFGVFIAGVGLVVALVGAASGSNSPDGTSTENTNLAEMMGESRLRPPTEKDDSEDGK